MEWSGLIITLAILFLFGLWSYVVYRLSYVKGYKVGAERVLAEWKAIYEEEEE